MAHQSNLGRLSREAGKEGPPRGPRGSGLEAGTRGRSKVLPTLTGRAPDVRVEVTSLCPVGGRKADPMMGSAKEAAPGKQAQKHNILTGPQSRLSRQVNQLGPKDKGTTLRDDSSTAQSRTSRSQGTSRGEPGKHCLSQRHTNSHTGHTDPHTCELAPRLQLSQQESTEHTAVGSSLPNAQPGQRSSQLPGPRQRSPRRQEDSGTAGTLQGSWP